MRVRPGRAKQFARQAKLTRGTTITLSFPERPETREWAEAIKGQIERTLDVKVKTEGFEAAKYYKRQSGKSARGLYRSAWLPDVPSAEDMLRPLLTSEGIASGNNSGRYVNKRVDKLLDQAAAANDPAKRAEYLRQAERQALTEDMAVIPLFGRKEYRVVNGEEFVNLRMDFQENPDLRVISIR